MDRELWERPAESGGDRERIYRPSRTFAQDVWFRFWHRPTAILGLVIILLLGVFAVAGPWVSGHRYADQNLAFVNVPPFFTAYFCQGRYWYITQNLKLIEIGERGSFSPPPGRARTTGTGKSSSSIWTASTRGLITAGNPSG